MWYLDSFVTFFSVRTFLEHNMEHSAVSLDSWASCSFTLQRNGADVCQIRQLIDCLRRWSRLFDLVTSALEAVMLWQPLVVESFGDVSERINYLFRVLFSEFHFRSVFCRHPFGYQFMIFIALHGMQTRSYDRNAVSVCSVRPSDRQNLKKGYYAVQGHSRSSRSVPIDSPCAISY